MRVPLTVCLIWLFHLAEGVLAQRSPSDNLVELDFTRSHDLESVLDAGLAVREFPDSQGRTFMLSPQEVLLHLPGGLSIQQRITHGSMDADEKGNLSSLNLYGDLMPIEEAFRTAKRVHFALGKPTTNLEKWFVENQGKGEVREGESFPFGDNTGRYPSLHFTIRSSMNTAYPWAFSFSMGWNLLPRNKDRDESWAASNNPRPPEGFENLSLNPPSGRIYDGKDAYRHLVGRQEEVDRIHGQVRGPDGRLIEPPSVPEPEERSELPGLDSDTENPGLFPSLWIIGGVLLLGVVVILVRALRRGRPS